MSMLSQQEIDEMAPMFGEMLEDVGFTGVKLERAPLPEAAVKALTSEGKDDDLDVADPAFAEELGYHRVTTDQGTFGIWFQPYVTLDISGTGLDITLFVPEDASAEGMPEGWCFIGVDEGTILKLFEELAKKER